jgi:steroid delta-isomerase-like uncharacterized protein
MSEANKALVRRWFEEVWNQGRLETIDELLAPECFAHGNANTEGQALQTAADFKQMFQTFRAALSDIKVTIDQTIAEGDLVAVFCTVRARHAGDGFGTAATQKPIEYTGMAMSRIKDGKIVEAWNSFDFLALYQQTGLVTMERSRTV